MAYRHAWLALVCGLIAAPALAPGPAEAADLVIHGRVGNVYGGIDTRDHGWRDGHHRDRRSYRRGHRHHRGVVDPFDPSVDERHLKRRFEHEKLFDGGSGPFWRDPRRALEGWRPPRKKRRDHRHDRDYHYDRDYRGGYYYYGGRYDGDDGDGAHPYGDDAAFGSGDESGRPSAAPAPPAEPAVPPSPRGPRFETARLPDSVPAVGERLPPGEPHVALDWQDYGLPEPPRGQTYVRFDGAVLLIESGTRIVRQVLEPAG